MSDPIQIDQRPEFSALPNTTTTTHNVSHEPQHWHHHHMTEIISSTPPPRQHSPYSHHSHHHPHNQSRSKLAYTIRPGTRTDLHAIHKIYTYYVLNSFISLLIHAPSIKYIEKAHEASMVRQMPYLVAVTKAPKPADNRGLPTETVQNGVNTEEPSSSTANMANMDQDMTSQSADEEEIVLGYGHIVPLHSDKAGYGASVELTMYLHPSYINYGVGSALLSALETRLRERPILVFEEDSEDNAVVIHAEMMIARMSGDLERDFEGVNMGMDDGGAWPVWKAQGERNKEWYLRKGFEEVGRMKMVGEKFGKKTDVIILQKTLSSA